MKHKSKRRPRVYVTNMSGHDYSSALSFGDLVFMSEGKVKRDGINQMYRQAVAVLEESHKTDYIMVSGLASQLAILCACFALKHGCLRLLTHDYESKKYKLHEISLLSLMRTKFLKEV